MLSCVALFSQQSTAADDSAPVLLVFGDSLSASYGLRADEGWAALLGDRLRKEGYKYRIVNASVSGETTAGGLARLPRALQTHRPAVVVLELGANDGLRALSLDGMRANLDRMIGMAKGADRKVLLLGIHMPPNYGPRYTAGFDKIYQDLAAKHRVPLVPFFMEGVALNPRLMQSDGLHPNVLGQPLLLQNIWPALVPLLGPDRQRGQRG